MNKDHRLSNLYNLIKNAITSDRAVVYNASVSMIKAPTIPRPSDVVDNLTIEQQRQLLLKELDKLTEAEVAASKQVAKVG